MLIKITFLLFLMISNFVIQNAKKIKNISFISENELDFTEERKKQLNSEYASQTIFLATNKGELSKPTFEKDGSFSEENKEKSKEAFSKTILNGIENKKEKFIYIENNKGKLIGKGLSENEIREKSRRKEGRKSLAFLTISRLVEKGIKKQVLRAEPSKTLKILSIGNSFSQDAHRWLYQIAQAAGYEDITIANLYWGGCSLWQHAKNAREDFGKNNYEYQLNTDGEIKYGQGQNIRTSVESADWDFITLQQASGDSGIEETYNDDLTYLVEYVKHHATNSNVKIVWHMTWAYQSDSSHPDFGKYNNDQWNMFNGIVSAIKKKIDKNSNIAFTIPAGTAVQNFRSSFIGDHITRDGYHMSYELGRYLVGLTWIYKICEVMGNPYPDWITYTPDNSKVPQNYLPAIHEAVLNAVKDPYHVTESSYKTEPSSLDTDKYHLLDWQPYCYGYWNSKDSNGFSRIISDGVNYKSYIASSRFDREKLPIGSVIEVANGYQYRPDGWTDLNQMNLNSRPDIVNAHVVTVTESWWGNYNFRGFNLLKSDLSSMEGISADEAKNLLKIYIPN